MNITILDLPIVIDRKASIYQSVGINGTDLLIPDYDANVILTSNGTVVEYWFSPATDPINALNELQIELNISVREFLEWTQGEDTYVDIILINPNKVGVFITTQHDVIYDEVHMIR